MRRLPDVWPRGKRSWPVGFLHAGWAVAAQWGCIASPSARVGKSGRGRLLLDYARGLLRLGHNEREDSYDSTLAQTPTGTAPLMSAAVALPGRSAGLALWALRRLRRSPHNARPV